MGQLLILVTQHVQFVLQQKIPNKSFVDQTFGADYYCIFQACKKNDSSLKFKYLIQVISHCHNQQKNSPFNANILFRFELSSDCCNALLKHSRQIAGK